jgi:peptidoglycan hydrolase CwlO-like protein
MDELFNMIGRLYADVSTMQSAIENLQQTIKDKDKEIAEFKKLLVNNEQQAGS